jgi:hypothetical protein
VTSSRSQLTMKLYFCFAIFSNDTTP